MARRRRRSVHLPFNFQLIDGAVGRARDRWPDDRANMRRRCRRAAGPTGCSATTIAPRIAARVGEAQARVAAMLLLTLRGTPTLYHGDEIGMGDVDDPAGPRAAIRANCASPGSGSAAIRCARRWRGTRRANAGLHARPIRGCRCMTTGRRATSRRRQADPGSMLTLHRGAAGAAARRTPRWRSASIAAVDGAGRRAALRARARRRAAAGRAEPRRPRQPASPCPSGTAARACCPPSPAADGWTMVLARRTKASSCSRSA